MARIRRARALSLWVAVLASGCCFGGADATPVAPGPVATSPSPGALPALGTALLANWQGSGFYFLGVAVGAEGDAVRVIYADGTTDTIAASATLPDRLAPGVSIDAHQIGETEFQSGTLTQRIGHAVLVAYADGRTMWTSVAFVRVRQEALPAGDVATSAAPAAAVGEPGSQVLAQYTDGHFYSAVVIDRLASGNPRVIYADGEGQEVTPDRLRPDTLTTGVPVQVRDRLSGAVLAGNVLRRVAHAVEVQLADGSSRWFALCDVRLDV